MRYSPLTCPFCSQQTQFDFDSESCYCIRCGKLIGRSSPEAFGGLAAAADQAFSFNNFVDARDYYSNAILSGNNDPKLHIRKAICGVYINRTPAAMNELIATYAQLDSELRGDPAKFSQRRMLAVELLDLLESEAYFAPRDTNAQPFTDGRQAMDYVKQYSAALTLIKDMYKYVPYDLLDEREALSSATQRLCAVAGLRIYHFHGGGRKAIVVSDGVRMIANTSWRECANDLAYIQQLKTQRQQPTPQY